MFRLFFFFARFFHGSWFFYDRSSDSYVDLRDLL